VDEQHPPFLTIHGVYDHLVPLGRSRVLAKAFIDAGVEVIMTIIPNAPHEVPQVCTAESQRLVQGSLPRQLKTAN
jgi:predicted esterase